MSVCLAMAEPSIYFFNDVFGFSAVQHHPIYSLGNVYKKSSVFSRLISLKADYNQRKISNCPLKTNNLHMQKQRHKSAVQ